MRVERSIEPAAILTRSIQYQAKAKRAWQRVGIPKEIGGVMRANLHATLVGAQRQQEAYSSQAVAIGRMMPLLCAARLHRRWQAKVNSEGATERWCLDTKNGPNSGEGDEKSTTRRPMCHEAGVVSLA